MTTERNAKGNWLTGRAMFAALLIGLVMLAAAGAAFAQHGYRVTKRISFRSGEVSTTVRGAIPNTLEVHEYVFKARAGQTAKIDLSSSSEDVTFYITDDRGNNLDEGSELRRWDGELPADGDYHVYVSNSIDRSRSYSLFIQIAIDI